METRDDILSPGALITLGGGSLLLYVLTKEWFVQTVGHAPRLVDQQTGVVWHLLENVPIALIGAGLLVWYRSHGGSLNRWDQFGFGLTVLGLASTMVSHVFEHGWLLFEPTASTGFLILAWWYYSSWIVTGLGLTTIGASRAESEFFGPTGQTLVVWVIPVSVVAALVLGATLFVSVSDGFKIPIVLAVIAIGINLQYVIERTDVLD